MLERTMSAHQTRALASSGTQSSSSKYNNTSVSSSSELLFTISSDGTNLQASAVRSNPILPNAILPRRLNHSQASSTSSAQPSSPLASLEESDSFLQRISNARRRRRDEDHAVSHMAFSDHCWQGRLSLLSCVVPVEVTAVVPVTHFLRGKLDIEPLSDEGVELWPLSITRYLSEGFGEC